MAENDTPGEAVPNRSLAALRLWLGHGGPVAVLILATGANADTAQPATSQIERGEYVARAAGCMSCHGEDLAGGYQVETPLGTIVASNISPSRDYGIGGYDRDDLASVLRRGVSPDRRLYPAMPYASYPHASETGTTGRAARDGQERAAQLTLRHGGKIWVVAPDRLPQGTTMAAALRY